MRRSRSRIRVRCSFEGLLVSRPQLLLQRRQLIRGVGEARESEPPFQLGLGVGALLRFEPREHLQVGTRGRDLRLDHAVLFAGLSVQPIVPLVAHAGALHDGVQLENRGTGISWSGRSAAPRAGRQTRLRGANHSRTRAGFPSSPRTRPCRGSPRCIRRARSGALRTAQTPPTRRR